MLRNVQSLILILGYFVKLIISFFQTLLAPLLHSPVPISAVCLQDGAVMGTMTVLMIVMNTTVLHGYLERALPISLPVPTTAASLIPGVVTLITTVGTVRMKLTAVSIAIEDINLKLIGFAMRHEPKFIMVAELYFRKHTTRKIW